jgi:splicing factor 3B subunit 1
MRLQMLEKEETRVRKLIEEKEKKDREEGGDKMDLDRTPS